MEENVKNEGKTERKIYALPNSLSSPVVLWLKLEEEYIKDIFSVS